MNPILRNVLACVAGILIGSIVNMGIVTIGPSVIPPPAGVDVSDPEALAQVIHLFEPKHFVAPFLAHALGTLVGAFVTFSIAATRKTALAYLIGAFFFVGGVSVSFMIPGPIWFTVLDLVAAYFPMSYLGARWAGRGHRESSIEGAS